MSDLRINAAPVDRWTTLHVASGVGLGAVGLPWWSALGISVVFEVVENLVQPSIPSVFKGSADNDSLENSVIDTAALMLGWFVANTIRGS